MDAISRGGKGQNSAAPGRAKTIRTWNVGASRRHLLRPLPRPVGRLRSGKQLWGHVLVVGVVGVGYQRGIQRGTFMEVYEGRTVYDLFNALAVCAKKERLEHQELAEQLAYKVLKKQFVP